MKTYPIPMVPGPVQVLPDVMAAYQHHYGSPDLEPEFLDEYRQAEANLQQILATENQIVIKSGEGMIALWGALKSCLQPGDRVLSLATGIFGAGIADMARSLGAEVRVIEYPANATLPAQLPQVEAALAEFKPKMITAVHCETPSGTLNPLAELGRLKQAYAVPLLYVDAVASAGGAPVRVDDWQIDLCLGGSQKCLAMPPSLSFLSVSNAAWTTIDAVDYIGYDALKPFREAVQKHYFPYTPDWAAIAALRVASQHLLEGGLESSFVRHSTVAAFCRDALTQLGIALFPAEEAIPAPTVTAALVPDGFTWPELDARFRDRGLVVGGSYGAMAGKVFRLGHMGTQAHMALAQEAIEVIADVVKP